MKRIPGLDGLRGLSIILVLLSHSLAGNNVPSFLRQTIKVIPGSLGVFGVEIFFVISGFVITYLSLVQGEFIPKIFFIKRAFKILPPVFVYIAFNLLVAIFTSFNVGYRDILGTLLFVRNIPELGYVNNTFAHFWSLSLEGQFYMFWPFLLTKIKNRNMNFSIKIISVCIIIESCIRLFFRSPVIDSIFRFHYMLVGCIIAFIFYKRHDKNLRLISKNLLISIGILSIIISFSLVWIWQEYYSTGFLGSFINEFSIYFRSFGISVVIYSVVLPGKHILYDFLNHKFIRSLGIVSYSIYIWQQFVFWPEPRYLDDGLVLKSVFPWSIFLAVGVGFVSFKLIEENSLIVRNKLLKTSSKL